jgi:hypothetical protein
MKYRKLFWLLAILVLAGCNFPKVRPTAPAATETATSTPTSVPRSPIEPTHVLIVEIPPTTVEIDGAPYQAYQAPGDPFRFACPIPCKVSPSLIYAQYAGFKVARDILLKITGVDTLPELQPVDIHVSNDPKCGELKNAPALSYAGHDPHGNAYLCTYIFEYAQGFNGQPYTPDVALRLDQQTILIHEYLHTIFFGRVTQKAGAMHDFVTPIALEVTGTLSSPDLCQYHPVTAPGDYGGWLIYNLCRDAGFTLDKFAPTMKAVDRLYRGDDGKVNEGYKHLVPTMAQFRFELHKVLGRDPAGAFQDACWPAALFEDIYTLSDACLYPTPTVQPTQVK